ncbi:MAG: DoxX family protein [Deltaproteobacteria bacterium]|nr:DoxX family protein [Deltaproteobacteria bacterium]
MRYTILPARILFASIFILSGFNHFSQQPIAYAAAAGVPLASLAVPASGILALAGGLSIALGYHARLGGAALVAFLVPVTLAMHAFWKVSDPMQHQMQFVMFMKNVALLGGAFAFASFGAGPLSLDARRPAPQLARAAA